MSRNKKEHAFERWARKGSSEYQELVQYAIDAFQPIMEGSGFEWTEESINLYGRPQTNSIEFQRVHGDKTFDYVTCIFDKNQKYKFSVLGAKKEKTPPDVPHKWLKSARVVRYQSELDKASWWKVRVWQLNRAKAFKKNVDMVAEILPHVIRFIDEGTPHPNIWVYG